MSARGRVLRKLGRITMTVALIAVVAVTPSAVAEPTLIECPDNTHIWGDSPRDCDYDSGINLGGGGGGNRCGGLCGILSNIPGLGGLFG